MGVKEVMDKDHFAIRFTVLRFTLFLLEDAVLPERKEIVLRGGIGDMLLKLYCIRDKKCETCGFTDTCIVQNFMYAKYKRKPDFVTTGESMGYVLSAGGRKTDYKRGERITFSLTLFGNVIVYLNPLIQAVHLLGQCGLGEERARYQIEEIQNRKGRAILENGSIYYKNYLIETLADYIEERKRQLTKPNRIVFYSPLTIKYKGEFIQEFDIRAILGSVTRRIYMLECFEGNEIEEKRFYENVPELTKQKKVFFETSRYSSRTKQHMPLKGICGEVELEPLEGEVLDYLLAGEITHIGKNTRFGFGKYKVL